MSPADLCQMYDSERDAAITLLQAQNIRLLRMAGTPYECYWRDRAFRAEDALRKLLNGEEIEAPEFHRADGASVCRRCGQAFSAHEPWPGVPWLKRLCDGNAVKL